MVNIIFIFYLQKNNNYSNLSFGMEKSIDDMLNILVKLVVAFVRSPRVFAQPLKLWAYLVEKLV
jgi:hypothetical protein